MTIPDLIRHLTTTNHQQPPTNPEPASSRRWATVDTQGRR